jgi:pyruvate/2-oxoglutarate dehydrogenase complex dihydrolipoamide acyltransferase (E2) component
VRDDGVREREQVRLGGGFGRDAAQRELEHDQVVPRWVTTLALSFDHRVVDGEQGSRFLAELGATLERADEEELT